MHVYIHVAALETAAPTVLVVWLLAWVDVGRVSQYHACFLSTLREAYVGRQAGVSLLHDPLWRGCNRKDPIVFISCKAHAKV